ncbi:metallophosphoesterase [Thalassotalea fonticola]|uniref:Metallophosphoesterase n=1 Tax=Thalassotalea fonticola TaxID=3065649 RepID=A0ABZ0GSI8_9GAMM|nr:metallophosphoesterase [Colwelliaceae bacterium S1-1]
MKIFPSFVLLGTVTLITFITLQTSGNAQQGAQTKVANIEKINDGPYVFIDGDFEITNITKICENNKLSQKFKWEEQSVAITDCSGKKTLTNYQISDVTLKTDIEFNTQHPIAAISDFHGQYDLMAKILKNNGVIDETGHWSFAKGHLVITGDVFDRGDKVTEILWFLFNLEKQAIKQGGRVHLLLGNHETMVLNNDLRYLHPKYRAVEKILEQSYSSLYGDNTILGQWLRSKNVLVKINDTLFAHGGFHPDLVKKELSLEALNQEFMANLIKPSLPNERTVLGHYLHKSNGPIWYRGYFKEPLATNEEINSLLNFYNINHIVVGHTSQTHIKSRYKGRVIAIDSSIKKGEYGEILLIRNSKMIRGTPEGNKLPIEELLIKK